MRSAKEYPVDVLIYATGFRFMYTGTFNRITGRTPGMSLSEKWSTGTKTFIGTHVSGFSGKRPPLRLWQRALFAAVRLHQFATSSFLC